MYHNTHIICCLPHVVFYKICSVESWGYVRGSQRFREEHIGLSVVWMNWYIHYRSDSETRKRVRGNILVKRVYNLHMYKRIQYYSLLCTCHQINMCFSWSACLEYQDTHALFIGRGSVKLFGIKKGFLSANKIGMHCMVYTQGACIAYTIIPFWICYDCYPLYKFVLFKLYSCWH